MKIPLSLLLILLLQQGGRTEGPQQPVNAPPDRLSQECLQRNYTRLSCSKVFCPPWRRCISGKCMCKLPYQCPRLGSAVCGLNGKPYPSYCHAQAVACRANTPVFSHYGVKCRDPFVVHLKRFGDSEVVQVKTANGKALVCGSQPWNMAAANVICRHQEQHSRGAASFKKVNITELKGTPLWLPQCMSVRCTGAELSLAECAIYEPQSVENAKVAAVKCYTEPTDGLNQRMNECPEFTCVNHKCIQWKSACDGTDHCGDNSDEMCCKSCTNGFHCKSGVCIPSHAVQDGIRDCLGGEDEVPSLPDARSISVDEKNGTGPAAFWSNPQDVIQLTRNFTEKQLDCGVPNMEYVYRTEEEKTWLRRRKRVVGGEEALPTQIQWQVAIQENGRITCGGVYLGGCWVLTAARCVRPKPQNFKVKFSLWKRHYRQQTSDTVRVKDIIIHKDYNARTHQNDIALVKLEELAPGNECLHPNPAVRAACVPWSPLQFHPGDTCTISGWGKDREGHNANVLKWPNVTIIGGCGQYHGARFSEGMECAGDLSGSVDFCQGDTGGPLVCEDAGGLSFVWGIMSWGEKCGEANFPGVYTKVSHYFEWIRFHTGWSAVTKYNQ